MTRVSNIKLKLDKIRPPSPPTTFYRQMFCYRPKDRPIRQGNGKIVSDIDQTLYSTLDE